ncbi:MAG: MBL fold metallo-hydrolase [Candidatus Saccharibacteria bacterium]
MLEKRQTGPVTVFRMGRSIGGFVLYYTHCFLVGDVLIDTGTVYCRDELLKALEGCKISAIINTHGHEDHAGNNKVISERFGAEIYAHQDALPYLNNPRRVKQPFYIRTVWDYPEPSEGKALSDMFEAGKYSFRIIHTPGHTDDHVCLYEPNQKWLFTGDLFCGERVKYLRQDEDFTRMLYSLRHLAELEVSTLFCCVAGVVENGDQALRGKIKFMQDIWNRTWELYKRGVSPTKIRQRLLGSEGLMKWATNGHFAKQLTIQSLLGLPH